MSKDEVNEGLQEPKPEDRALEKVFSKIRQEYAKNQRRPEIRKPLAHALYKVWREADNREVPKVWKHENNGK